jgi:hypothetical protein
VSLEQELRGLATSVEWPDAPDVASAVTGRIAEGSAAPRRGRRRRLALALAVVLAVTLAVLAVPPARTAIFDWLGIGGARIVRVADLPAVEPVPGFEILGDRVDLATARVRAGFPFSDPPDGEPAPDEIRVAPGMRVSYLWRDGDRVRLLLTQFPGRVDDPALVKKLVAASTSVEDLEIDGHQAVWLEGGPHVVFFVSPEGDVRDDQGWLAGNTLLVDRDGVTVRVEGRLDRDQAVDLVRALDD